MNEGFFLELWRVGLAEYDEMEGIAWQWQSVDGCMVKAPLAQETVGPNPTDRGKKWKQKEWRRETCAAITGAGGLSTFVRAVHRRRVRVGQGTCCT